MSVVFDCRYATEGIANGVGKVSSSSDIFYDGNAHEINNHLLQQCFKRLLIFQGSSVVALTR